MADKSLTGFFARLKSDDIQTKQILENKLFKMLHPDLYDGNSARTSFATMHGDITPENMSINDNKSKCSSHPSDQDVIHDMNANKKWNLLTPGSPFIHHDPNNSANSMGSLPSLSSGYNGLHSVDETKTMDTFIDKGSLMAIDIQFSGSFSQIYNQQPETRHFADDTASTINLCISAPAANTKNNVSISNISDLSPLPDDDGVTHETSGPKHFTFLTPDAPIITPIPSNSVNSMNSSLFDHASLDSIRSDISLNAIFQEFNSLDLKNKKETTESLDEDEKKPKKPISITIDVGLVDQKDTHKDTDNKQQDEQTEEFDDNLSELSSSHMFICKQPSTPILPKQLSSPSGKMKYFEMMKNINIFDSITDNNLMAMEDYGIASVNGSDDTELDSNTNLSVYSSMSPFTPFTPFSPVTPDISAGNLFDNKKYQTKRQWSGSPRPVSYSPAISPRKRGWSAPTRSPTLNKTDSDNEMELVQLMEKHLIQQDLKSYTSSHGKGFVYFDKCIQNKKNNKIVMISSDGLSEGVHEWMVEIMNGDIYQQEIGVIGRNPGYHVDIDINGIKDTNEFGARAVYGNESLTDSVYYGSWNSSGKQRCYRDLRDKHHIGWSSGDVIKVCLDLNSWKIKFWLNGVRVRKSISLQHGRTYYPVIGFSGNCIYSIVSL